MGGYQGDTFQCAIGLAVQKTTHFFAVVEQSAETSFFISCIQRLWDFVRSFLGRRAQPQISFKSAALRRPAYAQGAQRYVASPMLTWKLKC